MISSNWRSWGLNIFAQDVCGWKPNCQLGLVLMVTVEVTSLCTAQLPMICLMSSWAISWVWAKLQWRFPLGMVRQQSASPRRRGSKDLLLMVLWGALQYLKLQWVPGCCFQLCFHDFFLANPSHGSAARAGMTQLSHRCPTVQGFLCPDSKGWRGSGYPSGDSGCTSSPQHRGWAGGKFCPQKSSAPILPAPPKKPVPQTCCFSV